MKINQLKAGIMLSYLTMFLSTGISIAYTPVMLNILGQSEYGLYQLVASVVSYLSLLTFGFGGAYVRFFTRFKVENDKKNIAKLNGMFLIVYSIVGVIALLVGGILTTNVHNIFAEKLTSNEIETARILMIILVINVAISFPASVFNSYITANEQYIYQRVITLIKTITNPFLMLMVLFLGYGSIGMVVITTFLNISIEIAYAVYCFKKLKIQIKFKCFDFSLLKEITAFSSFIFINIVVDQINWNVDKFLLGMFKGTTAVAVYGIAAQLNSYYLQFSTTISTVFVPKVNQIVASTNDNKAITELFTKVGRIQFMVLSLILSGIIFWGQPFIEMWAGTEYKYSYIILLILIIPITIPLVQNLGIEIQRAKNLHKFRSWLYLGMAFANIVISIPLSKMYSGIGSAIGTAISLIIANGIIMNIYYHKKCGINVIYFWNEILKILPSLILPVITGIVILNFVNITGWISLIISIVIYTFIFTLSVCLFGMNKFEKELIIKPFNKIFRRSKNA